MPKMPLPLPVWENAMKCVDKGPSRVKKNLVDRGYCMPKPATLISGQTPEHFQLFMINWLVIHPLWISRLNHDPPAQFPIPQLWREILHQALSKEELEAAPQSSMGSAGNLWGHCGGHGSRVYFRAHQHYGMVWQVHFNHFPHQPPSPHHPSNLVEDLRDWLVI